MYTFLRKVIKIIAGWIIYIFLVTGTMLIYNAIYTGAGLNTEFDIESVFRIFTDLLIYTFPGLIFYIILLAILSKFKFSKGTILPLILNIALFYVFMIISMFFFLYFEMNTFSFVAPFEINILFIVALIIIAGVPYFKNAMFETH